MIRNLLKSLVSRTSSEPKPAKAPPLVSEQVLVFTGRFSSELEATDYALGLADTSLRADLGNVAIGPDDVEVIFGETRLAAAEAMFVFAEPRQDAGDANTYILLSDRGYDTAVLDPTHVRFVGKCDVS